MKIKIFDSVSDFYGSSRICRLIIEILRDSGHSVDAYVCLERLPADQIYAKNISFPMLVMAYLKNDPIAYIFGFIKRLHNFRTSLPLLLSDTDLIYCNTLSTVPVAWCCKRLGIPTVLHLHESANSVFIQLVGRLLLPIVADRLICVSHAVAKSWMLDKHPKTRVIHNGIPVYIEPGEVLPDQPRPYDLCFVGRLTEKKGIFFFLAALDVLSRDKPHLIKGQLRVAIAGGTLPGQVLPAEIQAMKSRENLEITYLGEIDDASHLFLQSKVACVPSLFRDPFPTVVLEAMRAGCAVVATELGGSREALAGACGELVKPGDVEALVDAIVRQHSDWVPATASHNRHVFTEQFTFDKFSNRLNALDILQNKARR
jgi:glycosyltransferase involved in cell wall biosynthesis